MKRIFVMILVCCVLGGCMGAGAMHGVTEQHKYAELEYTSAGLTSGFKLGSITTGSYKSYETQVGLVYYGGSQNTFITLDSPQQWSIKSESKAQAFKVDGIDLRLKNPYVGTVKRGSKVVGHIGLSLPGGDYTKKALDMVGLGIVMSRNYRIVGEANILGKTYSIDSVFKDEDGDMQSSPVGYRVIHKNKNLGMVKVGKNAFGGQTLKVWIAPGLDPVVEESVVACLLVSGYVF